jgi:hypothetical protein
MNLSPTRTKRFSLQRPEGGDKPFCRLAAVLLAALLLLATGCATTTTAQKDFTAEKLLVAAGFNFKEAQTPEQLAKMQELPQKKLLRKEIKGKPVYLYADATGCRCLYAGDEAAYNRFCKLRQEARAHGRQHKGIFAEENLSGVDEDWTAYMDDLDSGMLPDGM